MRRRTKPGKEPADRRTFKKMKKFRRKSCKYCGGIGGTVDHVIPISRGGRNHWSNMVPCCRKCNTTKGNLTPDEWKHRWYKRS